jgi:hypothetical protein
MLSRLEHSLKAYPRPLVPTDYRDEKSTFFKEPQAGAVVPEVAVLDVLVSSAKALYSP